MTYETLAENLPLTSHTQAILALVDAYENHAPASKDGWINWEGPQQPHEAFKTMDSNRSPGVKSSSKPRCYALPLRANSSNFFKSFGCTEGLIASSARKKSIMRMGRSSPVMTASLKTSSVA